MGEAAKALSGPTTSAGRTLLTFSDGSRITLAGITHVDMSIFG